MRCTSMIGRVVLALAALGGCKATTSSPDAVADAALDAARADAGVDRPRPPDRFVPLSLELTVNGIPVAMNGSLPYTNRNGQSEPFRLALPPSGFTIDVAFAGSLARPESLRISADVALAGSSAGADLRTLGFPDQQARASWLVPNARAFPLGTAVITAEISDGADTLRRSLTVTIVDKLPALDPFRLEDTWLLSYAADHYSIARGTDRAGQLQLRVLKQPNSLPDFDEDLRAAGLGTAQMLPAAATVSNLGVLGTNAIVKRWLQRELITELRRVYGGVAIRFFNDDEPGAPQLGDFKAQTLGGGETAKAFSVMPIGGGDLGRSYLGLAERLDVHNLHNERNASPEHGVFTTRALATAIEQGARSPGIKTLLAVFFGAFVPELGQGGKPVGEHADDAQILGPGFDPQKAAPATAARYQKLKLLVELLGRLAGVLTAHEIGHCLGLVADGPPPYGLFGGEKNASFVNGGRTTAGHIDTAGFNVMEAGPGSAPGATLDLSQYLGQAQFNELNLAYLRGRLVLLKK